MPSSHLAIAAHLAWGHIRPLCTLSAKLVKLQDLYITFLTTRSLHGKVTAELARNFEDGEEEFESRIRVVGLNFDEKNPFDLAEFERSFEQQFWMLANGESALCAHQQKQLAILKRPDALLVDIFCYKLLQIARRLSPDIKVWASGPTFGTSLYALFGPFGPDSRGYLQRLVTQHMAATGQDLMPAALEVVSSPSDQVIQAPGLLPIFKYENFPQERILDVPFVGLLHLDAASLIHECDALVSFTSAIYDPKECIEALDDFFALTSRKMHLVGPLISDTKRSARVEMEGAAKSPELLAFMQNALKAHGEDSLIYISFGTLFWSTQPDRLWTVLDVLMEKKIPFILSHASPWAKVPDEISEKIKASGLGFLTTWAPQQTVLEHPVTGWFLTHGGFNSITESIVAGVPMICWPFGADQALNTLLLTENLGVAYELIEVRTGSSGLKPVYRTGKAPTATLDAVRAEANTVLDKAFSEDGAKKRANTQNLKHMSSELWKEGGSSRIATQKLLNDLH
ncbi:glycosyltransferase family 1 protein [Phanerochaete carnosa HHB-10118-sp]|uniref:Glycosyltransferase family 1 protein n=1 Tax=Phanerochaete carnosa (strain HHB-10118-sp) TaxID=650164 RepID=K5XFM7_PHACS|nr:glycosyltransferase family 1 protein [Phanerochaete carnosa HHB-10118-sp]EKM61882.1 glycosyltransferase family 1 protein [Phanerochaete carnosa HHB-10118-sp]